jgi:hypothetical protein
VKAPHVLTDMKTTNAKVLKAIDDADSIAYSRFSLVHYLLELTDPACLVHAGQNCWRNGGSHRDRVNVRMPRLPPALQHLYISLFGQVNVRLAQAQLHTSRKVMLKTMMSDATATL